MNLARAVQVSIDTAVQPCKDWKAGVIVTRVQSMHPSVGDWGGHSMSLAGHLWAVVHILCDGQSLFMNGLGGCSSSFGGSEGMQLSSFMGGHPHFVSWRAASGWLEWVLLIAGGLSWVMHQQKFMFHGRPSIYSMGLLT